MSTINYWRDAIIAMAERSVIDIENMFPIKPGLHEWMVRCSEDRRWERACCSEREDTDILEE